MIISAAFSALNKAFDALWNSVTLLVKDIGINGATNSSFRDDGPYNFLPTRYGDVTQGSFSPFGPLSGDAPPQLGGSVYFDGSGDTLSIADNAALRMGTSNFTIEMWVYPTSTDVALFDKGGNAAGGFSFYSSGGNLRIRTTAGTYFSSLNLVQNSWNHVAVVRSGTSVLIYANGVGSDPGLSSPNFSDSVSAFTIGYEPTFGAYMKGHISNFRVVKGTALYSGTSYIPPTAPLTAISGTSLLTCQSSTAITDASSNAFTVSKFGDARAVVDSPFGYGSVYFDGSGDTLTVSDNTTLNMGIGDYTWELWFYATVDGWSCLMEKGPSSGGTTHGIWIAPGKQLFYSGGPTIYGTAGKVALNAWNHAAVTRASGVVKLWLNGSLEGSASDSTDYTTTGSALSFGSRVAGHPNGQYPLTGYVSNARIVKGSAVYTSAFAPPTAPLTAISGTSLLTCQDKGSIVDASTNSFTVSRVGDSKPVGMTPFAQKRAGYWSNYFDGSGDYLTVTNNSAFNIGTGDFTWECWYYPLNWNNAYQTLIDKGYTSGFLVDLGNAGTGTVGVFAGGSMVIASNTQLTLNAWNHIAVSRSGSSLKLYQNGVQCGTVTNTANLTNNSNLLIGIDQNAGAATHLGGYLSNMRLVVGTAVYTSAFTPPTTPLTAIPGTALLTCQDNRFKDNSSNNFTVTKYGDTSVSRLNPFGPSLPAPTVNLASAGSIYFRTGNADYMNYGTNTAFDLPGDFTIEFWINPTSGMSDNAGIVGHRRTGAFTDYADWVIRAQTSAGKIGFGNQISGGYYDMGPLVYGAWSHYAVTRSGSTVRTFCNGALISTNTDTGSYSQSTANLLVGENSGNGLYYKGYLSNLRIVKGTALYTSAFTPPTSPLTAVSGTSLLIGQDALSMGDASGNNFTATLNGAPAANEATPFKRVSTVYGGSGYFDGTGDGLTANSSAFAFGTGDFTVEAWVYPTSSSLYRCIFTSRGSSNSGSGIFFGFDNGTMYPSFYSYVTSSIAAPLNAWSHIALVRKSSTATIYVNGVAGGSISCSTNFTDTTCSIGFDVNTGQANTFYGYMSNLRVVKGVAQYSANFDPGAAPVSAVGGTSLLLNFDNAGIYDASNNTDISTVTGVSASTAQAKYGTSSATFPGTSFSTFARSTGNYNFNGKPVFTAECWFYPNRVTGTGTYEGIMTTRNSGIYSPFNIMQDNATIRYLIDTATGWNAAAGTLTAATWHHLAVCADGTTIRLFLNGTSIYSYAQSTWSGYGSIPFILGGNLSELQYFNGYIDDARLTMGVARYTANFTPPALELPTRKA